MKRLIVPVAALFAAAGCSHIPFLHKKRTTPEGEVLSPHVAAQVESDFEERWMAKRVSDLEGQGMTPEAAQAKAQAEFDQQYSFTGPAIKAGK